MKKTYYKIYALLAALFYGLSIPVSKVILGELSPYFLSSLVYLGAGFGVMLIKQLFKLNSKKEVSKKWNKHDLPYIIGMIVLDIIAPIVLMFGILSTNASTTALLSNFELVFTAIIALIFFKEQISKRLWLGISIIVMAGITLTLQDNLEFKLTLGTILILIATLSWGLENNLTRVLSVKDPLDIVIIKGLGSGSGALIVSLMLKQVTPNLIYIVLGLLLGFVAYGLSLIFYITAQSKIGASQTSSYFALNPFIGTAIAIIFLNEMISSTYIISLIMMLIGVIIVFKD